MSSNLVPVHLIILIHGLYGSTLNLKVVEEELIRAGGEVEQGASASSHGGPPTTSKSSTGHKSEYKDGGGGIETVVYLAQSIKGPRTWDGIDICAHRITEEVDKEIERLQDDGKDVVGVSVMGYSLGGLIARFLIGQLHARQPSFFAKHRPVTFSTAATPHLGVLKYGTRQNALISKLGRVMFGRTGRQIYCQDEEPDWGGRGLLEFMTDPNHVFIQALKVFPKVMILVNGIHDNTVPYPTAAISYTDPFTDPSQLHIETDENHMVTSYLPIADPDPESLAVNHANEIDVDGEEVNVTVKVMKSRTRPRTSELAGGRTRPLLPPLFMIPLPFPFNYAIWLISPLLLPIMLTYIAMMFAVHEFHSRRRTRSHHDIVERQPLLAPVSWPADESDMPSEPILQSTSSSVIPSRSVSTKPTQDDEVDQASSGTSTPPMLDPSSSTTTAAPLLLTPGQRMMIKNLNEAIPNAERVIAWFPWAFNSHAVLICRDVTRFPWQEDGRGVVKRWAKFVVDAGKEGVITV
ncbi:hypothetical protein CI109_101320 [Kwoniella shandongensis]|uniref:Uncharacterized protein n=1 Tax=Kwoniella shandongensis TaxID=1734106 RepID=A0A5M6BU24_9TREE|nr:uncharacterized protein CI109_005300 [Kwoniella shandongensis]KAA5526344.1 hypothetical protein CI109_005300 [Kwoniella shandongensis]